MLAESKRVDIFHVHDLNIQIIFGNVLQMFFMENIENTIFQYGRNFKMGVFTFQFTVYPSISKRFPQIKAF
jgi:hypothetical protein